MDILSKLKLKKSPYQYSSGQSEPGNSGGGKIKKIFKSFKIVVIGFLLLNLIGTGFYTVEESEQAVVTTFGKVSSVETAGPHFKLPFPIQSVRKVEVNKTQKLQLGYASSNENESKTSSVAEEAKMITGDFNIVNIDFFVEWKISDPVKFLYNSDNPTAILKMIAQSSARSIIGSKNVDGVLTTEKAVIQTEVREKMRDKLEKYDIGVSVSDVKIQDSEPPTHEVNQAFKEVETAKQERETEVNNALAYKNSNLPAARSEADKLIRNAEGYKESKINEAKGEVAGFNAMYEEYAKNREITRTRMYLETIGDILNGVTVYVDTSEGGTQKLLPLKDFNTSLTGGNQ